MRNGGVESDAGLREQSDGRAGRVEGLQQSRPKQVTLPWFQGKFAVEAYKNFNDEVSTAAHASRYFGPQIHNTSQVHIDIGQRLTEAQAAWQKLSGLWTSTAGRDTHTP